MSRFQSLTMKALAFAIICAINPTSSGKAEETKGCPFEFTVRQTDDFVFNRMNKFAQQSAPILVEMESIVNKTRKPGVPLRNQLAPQDLNRFNQLRHALIQLNAEKLVFGNFQRDVHLIAETYKVAELADLYETSIDSLGDADPRRFYFTILNGLRIAQPRTPRTPLISVGIDCDPEAGLYFEEEFNQQQLAKSGADQRLVDLVFDIERLRTLYQLSWNLFNKGIDDVRATTWTGDDLNTPDSITPMIAASSAATQNMYNSIIPYVDKQLPSRVTFEISFMQKRVQEAKHDYPARGK
jgi:hypothetical protein